MISTGIFMFLAVLVLTTHLSPQTKRRVVGLGLLLDIAVMTFFLTVFGGTGAERLGGIAASLGVTAWIHAYRWWGGYERLTWSGWQLHPPKRVQRMYQETES